MLGIREYPTICDDTVFDTMAWYRNETPDSTAKQAWHFAESFHRGIEHRALEQKKWSETYGHLMATYSGDVE
jgi:hypothetical protein